MGGKSNQIEETSQQKAMAEFATKQLQDYKTRWLPVQQRLATQIQASGQRDSSARESATGRTSTDAAINFAQAEGALSKALAARGANVDSSRSKLAMTGMGEDKAKTAGMSAMVADQEIDDAYTKGLMALTNIGRGERADVAAGLESQAQRSARDAATSAQISASQRAGEAGIVGQAAGLGLYGAMNRPPSGTGYTVDYGGMSTNNTGMQLPTAGGS
jgi:Holliday junction resolvasome RuvABC endonuclease subunit